MPGKSGILVVGGGASGLAAAWSAAENGARVTVLERLDRIGKKLLATGSGRCNLTNRNASADDYQTADRARLSAVLAENPPDAVLAFFARLGLLCDEETEGRMYPYCRQASMVLDILRTALQSADVHIVCGADIQKIMRGTDGFAAYAADGRRFFGQKLILSAGGQAAPQFGTDGSGFALARMLGHTVRAPYPCLVPLRCRDFPAGLKGLRANGALSLWVNGARVQSARGEVQFADYGFSGIPAMQLSCLLTPDIKQAQASMDFFPDIPEPALCALLEKRRGASLFGTLETFLLGLLNKKAGYAVLKSSGLAPLSRPTAALTDAQIAALVHLLKDWRFPVQGTLPWTQAQTTGGGVPLSEIDEKTCASRRCDGLYLTGELLDAVGGCGGYNLQWAWATGLSAGRAAGK